MKILFIINNGNDCYEYYAHTGILNAPSRRAVEIELTPEQIEKIGINKFDNIHESIESVSLVTREGI